MTKSKTERVLDTLSQPRRPALEEPGGGGTFLPDFAQLDAPGLLGPDRVQRYLYVGRLAIQTDLTAKCLEAEFIHSLEIAALWLPPLDSLRAATIGWDTWSPSSSESDHAMMWSFRKLVREATLRFRYALAKNSESGSDTSKYSPEVVQATHASTDLVRQAYWTLHRWQRSDRQAILELLLAEPCEFADVHGDREWTPDHARDLLVGDIGFFQTTLNRAVAAPPVSAVSGEIAVAGYQPFLDLCKSSRQTFLQLFQLLTLFPSRWSPAIQAEIARLYQRTLSVMPSGVLWDAVAHRWKCLEGLFPPTATEWTAYQAAASDPRVRDKGPGSN